MTLTDTHAHLYAEQFDNDQEDMLQRAFDEGVTRIFLPNIDAKSVEGLFKLCAKYPEHCFPMMGLHPGSVDMHFKSQLTQIKELLFNPPEGINWCAVGEIGMDLYWEKKYLSQQQDAFRQQIEWAKTLELPIVIHAREAFDEIFEIIDEMNDENLSGIFHCFTGTLEQAERIIDYGGFMMGLGGVLTFRKSGLQDVVRQISMEHFVLETDAPYLAPTPHRGKRNESAYLIYIAQMLADYKEISIEEVARITTENSKKLFGC